MFWSRVPGLSPLQPPPLEEGPKGHLFLYQLSAQFAQMHPGAGQGIMLWPIPIPGIPWQLFSVFRAFVSRYNKGFVVASERRHWYCNSYLLRMWQSWLLEADNRVGAAALLPGSWWGEQAEEVPLLFSPLAWRRLHANRGLCHGSRSVPTPAGKISLVGVAITDDPLHHLVESCTLWEVLEFLFLVLS